MFKHKFKKKQLCFRKWLNKKYAVFNSLGRLIKIGSLSLSYSLVMIPAISKAEGDSLLIHHPEYDIDEVTVAGSRSPLLESELAKIVNIIPAAQIETSPAQGINAFIDYLPGVDVRTRGPYDIQSDISVRGGTFEQTAILLNGVKITDPQTGHNSMNLPIGLNNISRVEFIKGASSRVFGPGAFGGALNFVVKPLYYNTANVSVAAGQDNYVNIGGSLNASFKSSRHLLSISHNRSDGYIENTDFDIYNFYYNGVTNLYNGELMLQLGYQDKAAGAQNFYTRAFPSQFEQMRTKIASISYEIGGDIKWKPLAYIRQGHDRFELYREGNGYYIPTKGLWINHSKGDTAMSFYKGHNYHLNTVYGIENNISYVSSLGTSTLGFEYRNENIQSNTMGDLMDTIKAPGETNGYFTKERTRSYTGVFLEQQIKLGNLSINGGVLFQWNSDFDCQIYPGLDVKYQLSSRVNVFANINKSTRLPSFTELYYRTSTHVSDPELKPENAMSAEMGANYKSDVFTGYISVFKIDGENLIDWVQDPNNLQMNTSGIPMWESENITTSNTLGVEMFAQFNLTQFQNRSLKLDNMNIGYSYLDKETSSENYLSAYSLDYLKHKLNIGGNLSFKPFQLGLLYSLQDRNDYFDGVSNSDQVFEIYDLFDIKLAYKKSNTKIYVNANNIFDHEYFDYNGIVMPGRWVKVGLIHDFNF